jgi:phage-related minor tail protein
MSENGEIKGVVSINADPAVQGFQKVEDAGKKAAESLKKAADESSKRLAGMGDGATDAAKKVEATTLRMAEAIARSTLATQAGGRATADFYEANARLKGLNVDTLKPFIDNLRAVEAQQRQATNAVLAGNAALGNMGLSAKQTAAALRQVPAQFTDIVVSLQGGQAPLTVLLQQGGQLKDVFGGVGNAARALGGYVLGLVNPFTLAAGAIGAIAFAYEKGAKEQREFEKTLILTGKAAGVTAGQLSDIAARIDNSSGATQGKAAEALNVFVNAGIKGADSLQRFTSTAIEFERAGGGALETVAENFAKLGKDPLKASLALNESINFLTRSLYEQIKGLEDQGKATEAAKVAQEAYNSALQDRTPQLLQNLGYIERGWKAITDATKRAYDEALKVGRASNPIDDARAAFSASQVRVERLRQLGPGVDNQRAIAAELARGEASKQILFNLQENEKFERKIAGIKSEQVAAVKEAAAWDEVRSKYLTKEEQLTKTIAELRSKANASMRGADAEQQAKIQADLAAAEKQARESAASKQAAPKDPTESPAYKEALRAAKLRQELRIKETEEIDKFIRETTDKQIESYRKLEEAADEAANKSFNDQYAASQKSIESIKEQIDKEKEAAATIGLTKDAIADLEAAKLDEIAASKDRIAISKLERNESQALYEKYKEEADSWRELAQAKRERGVKAAEFDELKKYNDELKKTAEQLNNSLTDAIMRGFENGKGFAENFRDTIKNMFKTLVLRPVISAIVNPVSQGVSGLLSGGPGAGGAGGFGGIGGLGGLISGGISSFTAGFQGAGLAAGLAGPTTLGAGGLTGIGASLGASAFAPALSALGTALPYLGAALALYSVFKEKKTPHLGSAVNANIFGATTDRTDYLAGNFNSETDNALRFLTTGSVGSLNKLDRAFGGSGDFSANAKFAADNKDASAADATIFRGSQEIAALFGEGYKLYTKDAGEAFKQFTQDFDGLTLQAIKSLNNVPTYVKAEFDKLGDTATTEGIATLVDQIGVFQGQLSAMKLAIGSLGSVSDEALASIIANVGGIQQFSSAVDAYYQNFFTETERLAFSTSQLSNEFVRLGVTMPTSREEFRDLTESIDKTSESGQKLYAGLLSLAGSFAAVVPAAEEAKTAIADIAAGAVEAAKKSIESAYAPLPSIAGTYVQNGVQYTVGNLNDLARAANTTSSAIVSATDAFSGLGDAITSEIKRIRGEITGGGANGQAASLAQFATLTAQARAGGLDALKDLPSASQAYLALVKENAGSQLEIRRAQGYVLGSLEQTQQTLGLAPVSGTAAPVVYQGPGQSGSAPVSFESMLQELRYLREEVAALRDAGEETAANTKSAADNLEGIASGRKVISTEEVT